ncbi:hypothetical protein B0H67DRAFT_648540 [Lasiosphaeris hirsuta]|uniref:Uncharacterized protein n=1 Tax=Lasiosphaeris hirsuta TaxID=260670 RepID=A0AA40A398_9PEZI|nr:hypothetical protein B0H67DRAFT_648540 [Lasiosphaeris hirsuta]
MDWSPRETFLTAERLDEFDHDEVTASLPCTVIRKFNSDPLKNESTGVERFDSVDLDDEKFWSRFMNSFPFEDGAGKVIDSTAQLPSGLCIFFCPRADDIAEGFPSELTDICITKSRWKTISSAFCLHNLLLKAIREKITAVNVASHVLVDTEEHPRYLEASDKLHMYTISTAFPSKQNFVVSSTHFEERNLTLAVVLGANSDQVDKVEHLLEFAEEAIGNRLLMLGLAAELMLDMLKDSVADMRDKCVDVTRELACIMQSRSKTKVAEYAMRVQTIRSESLWLDEAVKTTKRSLDVALKASSSKKHPANHDGDGNGARSESGTLIDDRSAVSSGDKEDSLQEKMMMRCYVEDRVKRRFDDVFLQLDGLTTVTRISVDDMTSTSTAIMGELNRQEAASSAQAAKTSTVIAFVAMLYLPMTTVATILAMPVFQFANDWRDWRYRPAENDNSGSAPSNNSSGTVAPVPVISGYLWIYVAFSTGLTLLTIEGWWRFAGGGASNEPANSRHWTISLLVTLISPLRNWLNAARTWYKQRGSSSSVISGDSVPASPSSNADYSPQRGSLRGGNLGTAATGTSEPGVMGASPATTKGRNTLRGIATSMMNKSAADSKDPADNV